MQTKKSTLKKGVRRHKTGAIARQGVMIGPGMPRRTEVRPFRHNPSPEEKAFVREELIRDAQAADARLGTFTLRDEANAIVAQSFRLGPLENLHAGKNSQLLEDESLSRITDEEMKDLMLNACEQVEQLLRLKESAPDEYALQVRAYNFRFCRQWKR